MFIELHTSVGFLKIEMTDHFGFKGVEIWFLPWLVMVAISKVTKYLLVCVVAKLEAHFLTEFKL